jgi:hypothetical protein
MERLETVLPRLLIICFPKHDSHRFYDSRISVPNNTDSSFPQMTFQQEVNHVLTKEHGITQIGSNIQLNLGDPGKTARYFYHSRRN